MKKSPPKNPAAPKEPSPKLRQLLKERHLLILRREMEILKKAQAQAMEERKALKPEDLH